MKNGRRPERLSIEDARTIALGAQGFGKPARKTASKAALADMVDDLGVLQMDSINIVVRAHYMPLFSRLGAYDRANLDALAWGKGRTLFEYWGHEASLLPFALHPLLRWRMERAMRLQGVWQPIAKVARAKPGLADQVLREVEKRGPVRASELSPKSSRGSAWWGWSETKASLEWLFWSGRLTTARRHHFERVYDVPERVLPKKVLAAKTPSIEDAHRDLLRIAARALGIATAEDLADYFRIRKPEARPRIAELVEEKVLIPVDVEGIESPMLMDAKHRLRRTDASTALLSPFDPVVWCRPRAERLFGFRYRLEVYTPAHRREHGYYVLPFLLDNRLVARVDLKADRKAGVLCVLGAHLEGHARPKGVGAALATELGRLAAWLDLDTVDVRCKGALAKAL